MDEKIDKKTEAVLMKALENAKAFGQRLQENREKRLWKEVNIPCSLHEAMNGLTKDEMGLFSTCRAGWSSRHLSSYRC